jgi:E3 ubiquitin-protein ligase RNF144
MVCCFHLRRAISFKLMSLRSAKKSCAVYVPLDTVRLSQTKKFRCPSCSTWMCAACQTAHPNLTCDEYTALPAEEKSFEDLQFLRLAQDRRYARCTTCRFYIEHAGGCSSMVCRCGKPFIYTGKFV